MNRPSRALLEFIARVMPPLTLGESEVGDAVAGFKRRRGNEVLRLEGQLDLKGREKTC